MSGNYTSVDLPELASDSVSWEAVDVGSKPSGIFVRVVCHSRSHGGTE